MPATCEEMPRDNVTSRRRRQPPPPARSPWKALVGGSIGNLVEWYDWFVYSSFAVYFASSFFPEGNSTAQLLNTMGIFAVGFLMRPVGGWLLEQARRPQGRKAALTATVSLMSASALLIAIAPTYDQAGYLGVVVLLVARLLQGTLGGRRVRGQRHLSDGGVGSAYAASRRASSTCR